MRKAGAYYGLSITCPLCDAKPPKEISYGSQRWRWLSVHIAEHRSHTLKRVK